MFPSKETVDLLESMCVRDGYSSTITQNISKNNLYTPAMDYLKKIQKIIINETGEPDAKLFTAGYLTCFHLFRLQIEAENCDLEDINTAMISLNNYIEFLETENQMYKNLLEAPCQ